MSTNSTKRVRRSVEKRTLIPSSGTKRKRHQYDTQLFQLALEPNIERVEAQLPAAYVNRFRRVRHYVEYLDDVARSGRNLSIDAAVGEAADAFNDTLRPSRVTVYRWCKLWAEHRRYVDGLFSSSN